MADIGQSLKIKYGLRNAATADQIRRWEALTRQYQREGQGGEAAGHAAARIVFPDYRTHVYASEADTIEALLREAGK